METVECFLVLGLEPTKDERLIKNAYREKLSVTNPEDDPEGFKRLRAAYEEACAFAKRQDDGGQAEEKERDTSPSGLWVEKAAEIYADIKDRQDLSRWEELFKDEIFQSLEEEENCRWKLLRFLMDHFRLPTAVWKILDQKMHLVADAGRLRESFPADFINYVVNRCERGEDIDFEQFEGADDAAYDLFFHYYDNCWQALQEQKSEEAARMLEEAAGLHIYHPAMEVCRGNLLYQQGKHEEAVAFMKALREKHPADSMVGYNTAEILWKENDREAAVEIYLALKEESAKHYMANFRLTEWYYDCGEYAEAKKCAESVLSSGADDSFMEMLTKINAELEQDMELRWRRENDWESALELCWCYLQDGKTSRGLSLATAIEKYIAPERETEYHGLLAKLLVESAEYEDAIYMAGVWEGMLEKKLLGDEEDEEREKDKDRIRQSHMIRMQSYKMLGYKEREYFEKAVREIETVETGTPRDIGLWLEKAQIYMEMEEYEKSLELTSRMIEEYQVYAAAATAMEVYRRKWDAGGVVQNARLCIQSFPNYIRAYEHLGRVYLDLKEIDALKELLAEAEKNQVESPYLDSYRYRMKKTPPEVEELNRRLETFQKDYKNKLDEGETAYYETGLPIITEYLYWYPGAYMLRRRASFHASGQQLGKALEDYEKALQDEPANPYIYDAMSRIYVLQGDFEQALVSTRKAILYGDLSWTAELYLHMAKIYMMLGNNEQALSWFRYYDKTAGKDGGHLCNMAKCLARLGRTDEAAEKMADYYRKSDGTFYDGYYRSLTDLYNAAGERDKARQVLETWAGKQGREPSKLYGLLPKSIRRGKVGAEEAEYYNRAAWQAMLDGNGKKALELLSKQILAGELQDGVHSKEGLEDMVFAAIVYGDEKLGRKYAAKLRTWINRESFSPVDEDHDCPKLKLTREFLADYYTASDEKLQELLDREKDCARCPFCMMTLCQELEGMRVLLLVRQGREAEARARLAQNLEVQPFDEYMQVLDVVLGRTQGEKRV